MKEWTPDKEKIYLPIMLKKIIRAVNIWQMKFPNFRCSICQKKQSENDQFVIKTPTDSLCSTCFDKLPGLSLDVVIENLNSSREKEFSSHIATYWVNYALNKAMMLI
jgi:hypothetical protein